MTPRLVIVLNAAWDLALHRMPVVRAARRAGYEVHLAYPPGTGAPAGSWDAGRCHTFPLDRRSMRPHKEIKTIFALRRLYRDLQPAIVHHFTSKPVAYGTIAARLARVPAVVNSITGFGFAAAGQDRSRVARAAQSALFRAAGKHSNVTFICQNDDDAARMRRIARTPDDVTVIRGSGVDVDRFRPVPMPHDGRVVYVGRLSKQKGVLDLIGAVQILRRRGNDVPVEVVGDVDPGNPASMERQDLELAFSEASIHWNGWTDHVEGALARAAVVVLPSHGGEGVPMSLLEAGAMGRALIATDVPGCRDVVQDGVTGLLVAPRDPEALAEAMERLHADVGLRERLGATAATHVRRGFGADTVEGAIEALYRHVAPLRGVQ